MFFLRGGVPLDLSVFLGRKGNPRSEQGFSFLPKTHLPFLALLRAAALRTCMGSTEMGFCLRCFYARLRCKRGRVSRPVRSELFAPFGACYSLHSERVVHSTRSVLFTPLGVCCSLHSECIVHSARSVLFTPLGVCCSLRSECIVHSARSVLFTPLGVCCSLRSE